MLAKLIHAIKRSAFLRLWVIFVFSAIILLILLAGAAQTISDPHIQIKQKFQNNIAAYSNFLIKEIGSPPDFSVAQKLSSENSLHIMIRGKDSLWKSNNYTLPPLSLSEQRQMPGRANVKIGHNFTYSYIVITEQEYEYIIAFTHRRFTDSKGLFTISLILIVIAVTALNYFLVQWLFRPLRLLDEGVKQVGEGNFDFRVNTKRQDEMGELAMAFNQMSEKIQSMMTEKEQLLTDVSHELRSPMTRMKLALEFIENNKSKISIQEDLHDMDSMITELLESARLSNPNSSLIKENINLNEFLGSIVNSYADSVPEVQFQQTKKVLLLNADRDRTQICIRNIIDNALKYSKNQSNAVLVTTQEQQNTIVISITDFGVGIPATDQNHIFEPFYRVDKSRSSETGGYGLGLNLCQKIMNAHGGEIIVNSIEETETRFNLVFPIS